MNGRHYKQRLVTYFEIDPHVGIAHINTGSLGVLTQPATHVTLKLDRGKVVLAAAAYTHLEGFAAQTFRVSLTGKLKHLLEILQRIFLHFDNGLDARHTLHLVHQTEIGRASCRERV